MNGKKQLLIQLAPVCIWCIIIFLLSHQAADESSELSSSVGMLIGKLIVPKFDTFAMKEQLAYAEAIQLYVRKAAHITEYAILSFLISRAIYNLGIMRDRVRWGCCAFTCSILYAMSDEMHQLFIPGRTGKVTDVLIDSIGIGIGILAYFLIVKWKYVHNLRDTQK